MNSQMNPKDRPPNKFGRKKVARKIPTAFPMAFTSNACAKATTLTAITASTVNFTENKKAERKDSCLKAAI